MTHNYVRTNEGINASRLKETLFKYRKLIFNFPRLFSHQMFAQLFVCSTTMSADLQFNFCSLCATAGGARPHPYVRVCIILVKSERVY